MTPSSPIAKSPPTIANSSNHDESDKTVSKRSFSRSESIFTRGSKSIPGGVNSPVRAFRAVGGSPIVIDRAEGAMLYDVDGNDYVDYVGSWGPMILGHARKDVHEALVKAAEKGTSFGACTEREVSFAELLCEIVPSLEKVRLVNSGTEATMSALRLARGFTKRDKIVKVFGGYHGHADYLLVRAGSGATTLGVPDSAGVPKGSAQDTLLVPFNDIAATEQLFADQGKEIAALIIEPVAGNMGCVPPQDGYLAGLRRITEQYGALLIFDEVMTGFRVALGGAQELYGITPDLTCLGKVIGGGLPVGAYGGRADVMDHVAPLGPVYQAGTLSGNPLAVAAGETTLRILKTQNPYPQLDKTTARLVEGLKAGASQADIPISFNRVGSMWTGFFQAGTVTNFDDAKASDTERYARYFSEMLQNGVYLAPSQFEAAFVSIAHDDAAIERTLEAAKRALAAL